MTQSGESTSSGTDSFARFWQDMAGTAADAARAGQQVSSEMLGQMRQTFIESMRKYMDEYVRSGQFSQMMQNVLTQAVTFRGQMADFLQSAMKTTILPEVDPAKAADVVRRLEQRLADRFDDLTARVGHLEGGRRGKSSNKTRSGSKPKSKPRPKSKSKETSKASRPARRRSR